MPGTRPAPSTPATLIIGAGRLGTALGAALQRAGWDVTLVARGDAGAARGANRGLRVTRNLGDCSRAAIVVICVPDDAVASVALALAEHPDAMAPHAVVLHTSGAVSVAALAGLAALGHGTGSLHPLQTVTDDAERDVLRGAPAAVSGDADAMAEAERVAEAVGLVPFRLDDAAKPLYHAASSIAANFTVALLDAAMRAATAAGMTDAAARTAFTALARNAVERVAQQGPVAALTGPIARGDVGTVRAHLGALALAAPDLVPLYREAGRQTLQLARRAGLADHLAGPIEAALADGKAT